MEPVLFISLIIIIISLSVNKVSNADKQAIPILNKNVVLKSKYIKVIQNTLHTLQDQGLPIICPIQGLFLCEKFHNILEISTINPE